MTWSPRHTFRLLPAINVRFPNKIKGTFLIGLISSCGSRKREHIDSFAHARVRAGPVMHEPVDSIHSEIVDDVRPIAVVVSG
jgi:hypothetical protein